MVVSLRDMAVDKQTHRHTDKLSQLLSPLALWAGGEKSKEKSNSNMNVACNWTWWPHRRQGRI